jgi:cell division protease FtsH
MYINLLFCSLFIIYSSAFTKINIKTKKNINNNKIKLKLQNNDYYDDLNIIQKFKFYFQKDDYNDVINDLINNKISKIFIDSNYKKLVSIDNLPQDDIYYNHFHSADINPIILPNIVEITSKEHIPIYFVNFTPEYILNLQNIGETLLAIIGNGIPLFFLLLFLSSLRNVNSFSSPQNNINSKNRINNSNKNLFNLFNNDNSEETQFIKPNVSLENWAGSPEVIEECKEVISYIENKIKYKQIGAEMPKGILLEGPPGTGKTLLAKAIASETNSTFISMSGSEFVELFVGMGAARVRELFESARNERPCIIFIDEIDAVGRQRGAGINMANDEREQTLNQLLYEMDGFNDNEDILVMAATNRKDILDQALLRPGRFDRIIKVPLPDKPSREKILEYYFKNKNTEKEFDLKAIAELTDGLSGAELKNLINEAAIISARNNYTIIQEKYIFEAFEKSIVGLIKKNYTTSPLTQIRVAIHESGHALLALKFNEYFDFQKVSIQPTYNGAGGYTIFSEKPEIKEGGLYTKDMLKKRLIITMGGKAAESVYYGNDFMSLGAIQDLKQANNLAKKMIGNFGMGDKLEVFFNEDIDDDSNPFLGRSLSVSDKYSQHTRYVMDKETINLVKEAYSEAKDILEKNKFKLIEFSELLQNNTIIYKKDIENDIDKYI